MVTLASLTWLLTTRGVPFLWGLITFGGERPRLLDPGSELFHFYPSQPTNGLWLVGSLGGRPARLSFYRRCQTTQAMRSLAPLRAKIIGAGLNQCIGQEGDAFTSRPTICATRYYKNLLTPTRKSARAKRIEAATGTCLTCSSFAKRRARHPGSASPSSA